MADNTQLNVTTSAGNTIATDDIGGIHFQRVKLIHGADGTNDGDVATANPLPVTVSSTASTNTLLVQVSSNTASTNTLLANAVAASSNAFWVKSTPGAAQATIGATAVIRVAVFDTADGQIASFGSSTAAISTNTLLVQVSSQLAQISTFATSTNTLLVQASSQRAQISTFSLSTNTLLVQLSSNTVSTNTLLTQLSTLTASTNTLLVQVSSQLQQTLSSKNMTGAPGSTALGSTAQIIKDGAAGAIYGYHIYNPNTTTAFVHFFNATTVALITTQPVYTIPLAADSGANLALDRGIQFTSTSGFSVAATSSVNGSSQPALTLGATIWYR